MGRIRYELGVSQHRHYVSRFVSLRWPAIAVVAVFVPLFFVSMVQIGIRAGAGGGQDYHRQRQIHTSGTDQPIASGSGWWLRVRPATMLVPSATPSVAMTTNSNQAAALSSALISAPDMSTTTPANTAATSSASGPGGVAASSAVDQPASVAALPPAQPIAVVTSVPPAIGVAAARPALPVISLPAVLSNGLDNPSKKAIAMQLVSSAENSSLDWRAQYAYIEDIDDGRGYTGGIIGFCSGTGDMLEMVQHYANLRPGNALAAYIPALKQDNGSDSHSGLGDSFLAAWKAAASDPLFQQAQNDERDSVYFNPAVNQAKADGLRALGQFIYYDAIVMHGPGNDATSFGGIRATAMKHAKTPAQGGNETDYLNAFLDARVAAMKTEADHDDVDRVETEQRPFLKAGNFDLNLPLNWHVYGDAYTIQ